MEIRDETAGWKRIKLPELSWQIPSLFAQAGEIENVIDEILGPGDIFGTILRLRLNEPIKIVPKSSAHGITVNRGTNTCSILPYIRLGEPVKDGSYLLELKIAHEVVVRDKYDITLPGIRELLSSFAQTMTSQPWSVT